MALPLAGPLEAIGAFIRSGTLTVIDGRGNIWKYDGSITEDADGNPIEAPTSFDDAEVSSDGSRLLVLSGSDAWIYNLSFGTWAKGPNVDELLDGETDKTTEPWKKGHNLAARPAAEESSGTHGK